MKRQTGSAMKPIAVLVPAISKRLITNVTVFADEPTTFIDYNGKSYSPIDYDPYKGSITLRQAVESSQNIPFVKIMEQLTPQVSIKYLKKMGITTLNDNDVNLALSLGGLDEGISPLEFAGAYNTIANDGVYIEPTFYTKINSLSGSTLFTSKQKKRRVFSKDVACVIKQLLTEPVKGISGTATYCDISGQDVVAKTGTTNENYDRWLCGFTNFYTAVCWYGFDMSESIKFNGKNPAGLIWSSVMKKIHSDLPNSKFEISKGVVTANICKDSGKVANSYCTNTYKEYFLRGTVPEKCTMHSSGSTNHTKTTNTTNTNSSNFSTQNSSHTYENNIDENIDSSNQIIQYEESNETLLNSLETNNNSNNKNTIPYTSQDNNNNTQNNTTNNTSQSNSDQNIINTSLN